MKRLSDWFRKSPEYLSAAEGRSKVGREARASARRELRAAREAANPAVATEAGIPALKQRVREAEEALYRARVAVEEADRKVKAQATAWAQRIERAEAAVTATGNTVLKDFLTLMRTVKDRARRNIYRAPAGAAEELRADGPKAAPRSEDHHRAPPTHAPPHQDAAGEAEVAKRLLRTRADAVLDPEPAEVAR